MDKVLLINRDVAIIANCTSCLEDAGYAVIAANSAEAALYLLSRNDEITTIITDMHLADMDGLQVISHVNSHYPNLTTILLAGNSCGRKEDYASLAKSLGADHVLRKPFNPEELIPLLEKR